MGLLIQHDHVAQDVLVAATVATVVSEVAATYLGQARDGRRRIVGSVFEAVLLTRRRDVDARDRWTKQIMVATTMAGFIAAYALAADVPSTRTLATYTRGSVPTKSIATTTPAPIQLPNASPRPPYISRFPA